MYSGTLPRQIAVLVVGVTKKDDKVAPADIELAQRRRDDFERDPDKHTWKES